VTGPSHPHARLRLALVATFVAMVVTGCGGTPGSAVRKSTTAPRPPAGSSTPSPVASTGAEAVRPTPSGTPSGTPSRPTAAVAPLGDDEWARMVRAGVWHPGCPVGRSGLRRVSVPFVGFDGGTHQGALVVNADVAASVVRIFTRLYDAGFPIRRMVPVEAYGGDDNASMAADNTSAFNCRRASQANAPSAGSPHANGRAVDVNPLENPWVDPRCGCFRPDARHAPRRPGTGVILDHGTAWTAFTREGWVWQDNRTPDYQHFDTGYPSRPLPAARATS
jgi:hypothetical protein